MLLPAIHFYGFLLACIFTKSYLAFKNDATEILYSHVVKPAAASPSSNSTLNQARNGGRHYTSAGSDRNSEYPIGGTSSASRSPGPSPARPRERSADHQPQPQSRRPRPGRAATGKLRLGEARAEGRCWLPSASPGGALVSLPPPCESCGTGLLGQVTSEGGASRNARLYGFPGREARKRKRSEAFPTRSIS